MMYDNPRTSFLMPKITVKFELVTPYGSDKCKWGGLKSATFDKKNVL